MGAIGDIGGIVSDIVGHNKGKKAAGKQNERNAYQAQLDRDWQERMSSTAHVREVADLKLAGLNPILSASGGGGAATGGGSTAHQMQNEELAGMQSAALMASLFKTNAETKNIDENVKLMKTQQDINVNTAEKIRIDNVIKRPKAQLFEGLNLGNAAQRFGHSVRTIGTTGQKRSATSKQKGKRPTPPKNFKKQERRLNKRQQQRGRK